MLHSWDRPETKGEGMTGRLAGKVAIVIGAVRGIGSGVADVEEGAMLPEAKL